MATGIMLCDDLIFYSRVAATAQAAGLTVRQVRTPAALLELAGQDPPGGVILDLHHERLDLPKLLAALKAACVVMPRTVAFGSHVMADTLKAARQAGCDLVLPRSRFVKDLETELSKWLTPPG
jgi:DNA-binding NarL/FixJ family response regulator